MHERKFLIQILNPKQCLLLHVLYQESHGKYEGKCLTLWHTTRLAFDETYSISHLQRQSRPQSPRVSGQRRLVASLVLTKRNAACRDEIAATLIIINMHKAKERINHSSIHDMYYQITYVDLTNWQKQLTPYFLCKCSLLHWSPINAAPFPTDVENASWSCINKVKKEIAKAQIEKAVGSWFTLKINSRITQQQIWTFLIALAVLITHLLHWATGNSRKFLHEDSRHLCC